jgi:hypothetical protein
LKQVAISPAGESLAERIVGILFKSLTDPVPNVRLVSIKNLKELARRYEGTGLKDQIKKGLMGVAEDPDKDVKFYCAEAVSGM